MLKRKEYPFREVVPCPQCGSRRTRTDRHGHGKCTKCGCKFDLRIVAMWNEPGKEPAPEGGGVIIRVTQEDVYRIAQRMGLPVPDITESVMEKIRKDVRGSRIIVDAVVEGAINVALK